MFFRWFRQRATNVKSLLDNEPANPFEPEAHVLISAGLDSLAKYWQTTYRPDLAGAGHRVRFAEFLLTHADAAVFSRVCGPLLRARATKLGPRKSQLITRVVGGLEQHGSVRYFSDDPTLDELAGNVELQALGIGRTWLQKSRFGEVLYSEYRCNWVHEFQPSKDLAPQNWDLRDLKPRYQNVLVPQRDNSGESSSGNWRHRVYFPTAFLLETYSRVISSFESDCLRDNIDPSRPLQWAGPKERKVTDIQALAAAIRPLVERLEQQLHNEIKRADPLKVSPPDVLAANKQQFEETHARWAEYHQIAERVRALAVGGE